MILAALLALSAAAAPATHSFSSPTDALEPGARLIERRTADLDRDGIGEEILVAGIHDPDGDVRGGDVFNGTVVVHVLQRDGARWREAGCIQLDGVPEHVVVADVGDGAQRTRLLFTGADHCGASCNGMELHAHALIEGRLVPFLPEETKVWKGWATVVPGKFVELWTRADEPGSFVECCPSAFEVTRLVPRGGRLAVVESAHVLAEEATRAGVLRASGPGRLQVAKAASGSILPAAVLADRSWLVRDGRSIGKILLGMTTSEVHGLLGPPAHVEVRAGGVAVERWGDRSLVLVFFASDHVAQISVTSPRFHTGRGIRTGDPAGKVREGFRETAHETKTPGGRTLLDASSGIAFEIAPGDPGRVSALIVHPEGADAEPLEPPP